MKRISNVTNIFKIIFFMLLCIDNFTINSFFKSTVKPISKYLFLQQFNDMCMIAPMINLKLLEQYLAISANLENLPENAWLTRRQWFGEADRYLYAWHAAFDRVNSPRRENLQALKEYLLKATEDGLVTPHFYDKNGEFLYKKITGYQGYFNIHMLAQFAMTPYFFIDASAMRQLDIKVTDELIPRAGVFMPFVKNNNQEYLIYNNQTHTYENSSLPRSYDDRFLCPNHTRESCYMMLGGTKSLGFNEISYSYTIGKGFLKKLNNDEYEYFPYMLGLAKLIFLSLGIDNNNDEVTEGSPLYDVCQDIKRLVQLDAQNNPWSDEFFDKEKFLQYKLAQMFKEDPELFGRAKAVVDISAFKQWELYTTFLEKIQRREVYKSDRTPYEYEKVRHYLLGDEQFLAYLFTQNIRFLWYGTLNEKAFYEYTIPALSFLESRFIPSFFANNTVYSFTRFVRNAFEKKQYLNEEISFIDVWNMIVENFKAFDRKNWVSFDAHGWVVSFDDEIVALQQKAIQKNLESKEKINNRLYLLKALGCAGIESSHSGYFNSFYKKEESALNIPLAKEPVSQAGGGAFAGDQNRINYADKQEPFKIELVEEPVSQAGGGASAGDQNRINYVDEQELLNIELAEQPVF